MPKPPTTRQCVPCSDVSLRQRSRTANGNGPYYIARTGVSVSSLYPPEMYMKGILKDRLCLTEKPIFQVVLKTKIAHPLVYATPLNSSGDRGQSPFKVLQPRHPCTPSYISWAIAVERRHFGIGTTRGARHAGPQGG